MVFENPHLVHTLYNFLHAVNLVTLFLHLTKRMKQVRKLIVLKAHNTYIMKKDSQETMLQSENKLKSVFYSETVQPLYWISCLKNMKEILKWIMQ